jgi:hypothetical protein
MGRVRLTNRAWEIIGAVCIAGMVIAIMAVAIY